MGLIASALPISPSLRESLDQGIAFMNLLGLEPILGKYCFSEQSEAVLSLQERASDFNDFLSDQNIKAIINLWGGYNSNDILSLINWQKILEREILIIGASDFTFVLNGVYAKTQKITYHWGNLLWVALERYKISKNTFKNYFLNCDNVPLFTLRRSKILRAGYGSGVLIGGNLESLERLVGTEYFPVNKNGVIIFIEDVGKNILLIKSILRHMIDANIFNNCKGLILGNFSLQNLSSENIDEKLVGLFIEELKKFDFPIILNSGFGHEVGNDVLPVGMEVCIDTKKLSIISGT